MLEEHNNRMLIHAHAQAHGHGGGGGHGGHGGGGGGGGGHGGRAELKSFSALRAAADAHAAHRAAADHMSPSMLDHERGVEEARMRRAKARAEYLMQRAEEEQTRAEVYALNRLMRRREVCPRAEARIRGMATWRAGV